MYHHTQPGKPLLAEGQNSIDFGSFRAAQKSPLARRLFQIEGVSGVFFGQDFVTVTISDTAEWSIVRPDVFSAVQEHYASGDPLLIDAPAKSDTAILPEDSETVAMIKELIETRIRPTVQDDGGDICFRGFDANGVVHLEMQGSCKGCPSSAVTLKNGIEVHSTSIYLLLLLHHHGLLLVTSCRVHHNFLNCCLCCDSLCCLH